MVVSHCAAGANFTINVWRKWKYYLLRYDSVIGWEEAGGYQMEQPTIRNLQNVAGCWWVANYPGQGGHWGAGQCPVVPRLMVPGGDQGGDPGTLAHWRQENVPFKSGSAVPTPLETLVTAVVSDPPSVSC